MRTILFIVSILTGLLGVFILHQAHAGFPTSGRTSVTVPLNYQGPGDVQSGWTAWYGVRAFNHTLANAGATTTPVMDVRGVTTTTSCTIFLLGNGHGEMDFTTAGAGGVGNQCLLGATTFCTSTNSSCTVSKLYDQTVGSNCTAATCNLVEATTADQPTLIMPGSCSYPNTASLPCLSFGSGTITLFAANNFTANASLTQTLSAVGNRSAGTGNNGTFISSNGTNQRINTRGVVNNWDLTVGGSASVVIITATDAAWHAANAVMQAGASADIVNLDGTETTGTGTPTSTAGKPEMAGVASTTILVSEGGFLDNFIASSTIRSHLCKNQANYYGTTAGATCS